jgi:hypothetical protein
MLTGHAAIDFARAHGLTLASFADPDSEAYDEVSVQTAEQVASMDPRLVGLPRDFLRDWAHQASNLNELMTRLRALEGVRQDLEIGSDLPKWGEAPVDAGGVWSYDSTRLLRYLDDAEAGGSSRWVLESRDPVTRPSDVEELRTAVGANDGEPILDALLRYTFAVQLGCALKLEQHAAALKADGDLPGGKYAHAGLLGSAAFLRKELPEGAIGEPDAITRWKAEQLQALKNGWLEEVFPRFWEECMGGLPHDAVKARLREMLEEFEPGVKSPEAISDAMPNDERVRRAREWLANLDDEPTQP